jgi:hypothetical protein
MLVYAVYELQLRQLQGKTSMSVVVPAQFIDAGTVIKEEMLEIRRVDEAAFRKGMISDTRSVIGLEALIPLGRGEPLLDWKLDRMHLMPRDGESTFQIPKSYILSISSGIRAGDQVLVYVSSESQGSKRLFEEEITVASVKSASYTEVDDAEHSALLSKARDNQEQLYVSRRDASAPIDHINLNLSEEQWLLVDHWCREGQAKLVIAYSGTLKLDDATSRSGEGEE